MDAGGTPAGSHAAPVDAAPTFGVLGTLEVHLGALPVPVAGRQERAVLALLLTTPGRVLPVASIVAGLWGEHPPGGAGSTVTSYVSRLRRGLPDGVGGTVVTRRPGYVLTVDPEQVDASRFRALVGRGHRERDAGRPDLAAASLRDALALWRGDAYAEFDAPFAVAERTALAELRLATLEDRAAAELALGGGPDLVADLETLVAEHPLRERLRAQLMTALYRSGRQADALRAFARARAALVEELGVEPGDELQLLHARVLAHDPALRADAERLLAERIRVAAEAIPEPRRRLARSRDEVAEGVAGLARVRSPQPAPTPPDQGRRPCPFKGLAPYDVDDAPYFAGRDRLVARLVARLVGTPLLAVVGPSGSGKSSVVRAGLVAAVRRGVLPGSERWRVVVTTPARDVPDVAPAPGGRTVLVVDGLEEMFTALGPEAQVAYAAWVVACADRDGVAVVVTLRADRYAHVLAHPHLAELVAANTVLVGALSPDELREAVEVPAAAAGLTLDPGLADALVADVAGEPGGLPPMSTALLALWERGDGRRLSLADYRGSGGVRAAVATLAEAAYAPLPPGSRAHARRVLLRLVDVDEAGEPVRRRAPLAELAVDGDPDARAALDALAAGRLLTVSAAHVEVAHEALLRDWPRLRAWLDDSAAGRRVRRHLAPAAAAWQAAGRDPAELYRGPRLAVALDLLAEHEEDLTTAERDFLRAGRDRADADAAARRRAHRRLRALAAGLAVALVAALGAGWAALDQRDASARLAVAAEVRALRAAALGEDRWDLALLHAAQAYRVDASPASYAALLRTVHRSPEATALYRTGRRLLALAVSDDGRTLVGLGSAGTVHVWDLASGTRAPAVRGLTQVAVSSLDLSPDGRFVAVVGIPVPAAVYDFRGQLTVVDLHARPGPTVRTWPGPGLTGARFAPDGRTVVTAGADGRARRVDVSTGRAEVVDGVALPVGDAAVLDASPGRRFLAAADPTAAGRVTVWETGTGRVVLSADEDGATRVAVDPTGTALVLARAGGGVEHLDLVTGARRGVPSDPGAGVEDLDWAPDGRSFAAATRRGTVVRWDAATLAQLPALQGHTGTVSQVVHAADGSTLLASGYDGAVLAWDLTGTRGAVRTAAPAAPAGPFGPFRAPNGVVAADGSTAARLLPDEALELLDVRTGTSSVVPLDPVGAPAHLVVDPSGRSVALLTVRWPGSSRGEIQVVDVAGRRVLPARVALTADYVTAAPAFSGDGRSLVTADLRTVLVWDVRTGGPVAGSPGYRTRADAVSVASDATARLVAVGVAGGHVEVGDLRTGTRVRDLVPPGGDDRAVLPLAFSPDGRWLAGGSESGRVVLWDTGTWEVRWTWDAVPGGAVDALAFTSDAGAVVAGGAGTVALRPVDPDGGPGVGLGLGAPVPGAAVAVASLDDGRSLVTLTQDRGVLVWPVAPEDLVAQACAVVGRELTGQEWHVVAPGLPPAPACGGG
ncbi:BTAD domain-containing putative transcriptional regulator [Cellulomonas endophytica]|uniref:nSTAND1 domain-containing NTPase n=1 Tax=Cellulomonas endophytica TaxID=2494735 RepID=UPI001010EBF9|nr:BTAD domain-containing putative transcriptional regulator [Cellulomonas endophytica]